MADEQTKSPETQETTSKTHHAADSAPMEEVHNAPHGDTTEVFGMRIPYPVYTVVFGALAVLTLLEVLIGTGGEGFLRIPLLVAIAVVKAGLVVLYYMHLKTDSRWYRWTLGIPLFIAIVAILWLLIVPPVAY